MTKGVDIEAIRLEAAQALCQAVQEPGALENAMARARGERDVQVLKQDGGWNCVRCICLCLKVRQTMKRRRTFVFKVTREIYNTHLFNISIVYIYNDNITIMYIHKEREMI